MNDKVKAFFREKGFYVSLLVGVIAVLAVGIISANMLTGKDEEGTRVAKKEPQASLIEEREPEVAFIEPEPKIPQTAPMEMTEPKMIQETQENQVALQEEEPEVAPVISQGEKISNLKFDEEKGLLWPLSGEVILPYSMEKSVYFKTLAQYKCNPAMLIEGKEGMEVLSACNGVITTVDSNEETGTTITMSIGNDYELVYGNLKDVTWKAGDFVLEGSHLADLAAPTKYYVEEGTNLYFQVIENGEEVDPLLVLR
ncbi:MAG: M23 family metallopeptidase [Acetivibrio sp.]